MLYSVSCLAEPGCPPIGMDHFGPYDYYDPKNHLNGRDGRYDESTITIVTNYHFTQSMIRLEAGRTGPIATDLDYTLRALPNHPIALDTVSRFKIKRSTDIAFAKRERAMPVSVECYFKRATSIFGNGHPQTWFLWGLHEHRRKQYKDAIVKYKKAIEMGLDSAELHYNLGLAYLKVKIYNEAKKHSDIAYSRGYPLPGLREMLKQKGY